eukprot:ctg_1305.g429
MHGRAPAGCFCAPEAVDRCGRPVGRQRLHPPHREGRAVGVREGVADAHQSAAAAAGQVARFDGCGEAVSAATPGHDREPRGAGHAAQACAHGDAGTTSPGRRRRGATVPHLPQRAADGSDAAHRHRAAPEAAHGGRVRARVRTGARVPQRGRQHAAQSRIHQCRDIPGVRRLPRHDASHRGVDTPHRAARERQRAGGVSGRAAGLDAALATGAAARVGARQDGGGSGRRRLHPGAGVGGGARCRLRRADSTQSVGGRGGGGAVRGAVRARAGAADVCDGLPGGGEPARQAASHGAWPGGAFRALLRRARDRQRLLRADRCGGSA